MKSSKAQILAKFHKIPVLRFEDQQLTSFSGLLIFQQLFQRIQLKRRLRACFAHLTLSPIFGRHLVVLLLVVHLLLGFRRLREVDYYRPVLDAMWEMFGPSRLIYASNWPVSALFAPLATVQGIVADYFRGQGREAEEQVFARTGQAAYRWVERKTNQRN